MQPYRSPACDGDVILLTRDTLHFGQTAESRALSEAVGPETGAGQRQISCVLRGCDADCLEVAACVGMMSWARDREGRVEEASVRKVQVAADSTWMNIGNVRHSFRPGREADLIRVLYQALIDGGRRGNFELSGKIIGERIESSAERLTIDHVFAGHDILNNVARSCGK